jgi:hypothetical protein
MNTCELAVLVVLAVVVGGCANPGIVQVSPDTYRLARDDHAGVFGNRHALAAGVIRDANNFAERQGKVAIPVSQEDKPVGVLGNWASFSYTFKLVDKDSPAARERAFTTSTHTVLEQAPSHDVYVELTKLDDLRRRGLLTDAEFETEKRKVLGRQP